MPASAIGDDDASQSFDKYENSLSVHSQSFDGSMPQAAAEHQQQQPYESALPPHQQSMADPRRLSDHHPYESALPPHPQQMNNRISEVA